MGTEIIIDLGAWTALGWVLDTQRTLAGADRALAGSWIFQSGVQST